MAYCQTAGLAWKGVKAKTIQVECIGSMHDNLLSEPDCTVAGGLLVKALDYGSKDPNH